ncbi:hypothetical protein [Proteus genomosp. 6]|uniref:hypothetical protein n=1 Tax=Proteus genomosp. 6 TaxID=1311820 RepID=UPI000D68800C|nr:hypothetical protein [Proteus genomosp. 6]
MIIDIPTKNDFYTMADHIVNEAWEKVTDLAYNFDEFDIWRRFYKEPEYFLGSDIRNLDHYWAFARPKLITAFNLILQSIEFRLKGLIVEISPYLLITNATRNPPKSDRDGNISFSAFRTLDSQDLIKVHNTFSSKVLPDQFTTWFNDMRTLRNRFMHSVDKTTDIMPDLIFTAIVRAHNYLNTESAHWIWHRYNYRATHASGSNIDIKEDEEFSGIVWSMLQTHYEFTSAISVCSKESVRELFGYTKNDTEDSNPKESFYCRKCVSVMEKGWNFDSKHLDRALETVQYHRGKKMYICAFCLDEQKTKPREIWEEDD